MLVLLIRCHQEPSTKRACCLFYRAISALSLLIGSLYVYKEGLRHGCIQEAYPPNGKLRVS